MGFELMTIGIKEIERGAFASVIAPLLHLGGAQTRNQRSELTVPTVNA